MRVTSSSHSPRPAKWIVAVTAVLALVTGMVAFAASSAGAQGESPGEPEVAVIMDASSSMLVEDVDGSSRLDAAKAAAAVFVESLPDPARVGMLAYGSVESDAPDNREAGCADIRTLAPVDELDADVLLGEIDGLEARGYTPIGDSLYAAAEEFSGAGERTIVLVSDGQDTCAPPPPCEVAAELAEQGIGTTIHTVGFLVDEAARAELECIAGAAGGEYHDAVDADELADSMELLTRRGIEGYETAGTPFEFALEAEEAQYLGEGMYQTTVGESLPSRDADVPHYFRVAVPEGHLANVSATPIIERDFTADGGEGRTVHMSISAENGAATCDADGRRDSVHGVGGTWGAPGGVVTRFGHLEDGSCDGDAWLVNVEPAVEEQQRHEGQVEIGVEVSVQFEPEASEAQVDTFPEGDSGSMREVEPVPSGSAEPTRAGLSFSEATEVDAGTYSAEIVPGEVHYYRMGVDWGQRPVFTLRSEDLEAEDDDRLRAELFSPLRGSLDAEHDTDDGEALESTLTVNRLINYRNRETNQAGRDLAMAGDYFVGVSLGMGQDAELDGVDRSYELSVDLEGTPAAGPEWRPTNEPGPEPSAEPIAFQSRGAADEGAASDPDGSSEIDEEAGTDGITTGQWAILGALGALVLVAVAAALWVALRKRR